LSVCLFGVCRDSLLDLCLDGLEVEALAFLDRRVLDARRGPSGNLLLHKLEAPELEDKPVVERQRTVGTVRKVHAFERIKTNISQDWPINLDRATEPTTRLIGESVLVVVDAPRGKRAFGEVKDLVTS